MLSQRPARSSDAAADAPRFADWPLALKSILGFWLFYALTVVARAFLGHDPVTILLNQLADPGHRHRR